MRNNATPAAEISRSVSKACNEGRATASLCRSPMERPEYRNKNPHEGGTLERAAWFEGFDAITIPRQVI